MRLLGRASACWLLGQAHSAQRPTYAAHFEGSPPLGQLRHLDVLGGVTLGTGEPRGTRLMQGNRWSRPGVWRSLHRHHFTSHSALPTLLAPYRSEQGEGLSIDR